MSNEYRPLLRMSVIDWGVKSFDDEGGNITIDATDPDIVKVVHHRAGETDNRGRTELQTPAKIRRKVLIPHEENQ